MTFQRGAKAEDLDSSADKIRLKLFDLKKEPLTESQVSQVAGRNTQLMYICFVLSNIVGVNIDGDIKEAFNQKKIEEAEKTELGYIGLLREVLVTLWKEKYSLPEYRTEDGYVKIANKEIYDTYIAKLKKEYGEGVSPAKFKEYMLEFGFTDALNRKKLEVQLPNETEAQTRLCNIFTAHVSRKLGVSEEEKPKEETAKLLNPFDKHIHGQCRYFNPEKCVKISNVNGGSCRNCLRYFEIEPNIHKPPKEEV